jgi:hypothetical protein
MTASSPDTRIFGPLPRRDILAVCAFLNRSKRAYALGPGRMAPDDMLERLAAAARMQ